MTRSIAMPLTAEPFLSARSRYLPILNRLQVLFEEMDQAYETVARQYGFQCRGCADSCCRTRFHHHTLLEYIFLLEGMRTLGPGQRPAVHERALAAVDRMRDADRRGVGLRSLCALNGDGLCMIYAFRPMICRLHGIPHELKRPDGNVVISPGCDAFSAGCRQTGTTDYVRFDRTPFYRRMALLEKDLRERMGYAGKIKLTLAQMLVTITDSAYEID